MKRNKHMWAKGVSFKMSNSEKEGDFLEVENKRLSSVIYITYNSKQDKIYVACSIRYGGVPVRTYKNGNVDFELKNKVMELMRKNPKISSREIHEETGYSTYRLSRIYMTAKRELC